MQARGEIASSETFRGNQWTVTTPDEAPATLGELGISRQRLHEARKLEPLALSALWYRIAPDAAEFP